MGILPYIYGGLALLGTALLLGACLIVAWAFNPDEQDRWAEGSSYPRKYPNS